MLIENPLNASSLAYPILECFHIAGFVCGVGTIALVNFRLLDVGLTRKSAAQLWRETMPWTLGGLTVTLFSGLMLFSIDPELYYVNPAFRLKMLVLAIAAGFYYTIVRKTAADRKSMASPPIASRWAACISLGLWALVPSCGVFIGYKI